MKKFSSKYLSNYNILSKAVIGFEFECFFETSFYKTLELFNLELAPVKLHGFRTYHSDFPVDNMNFKLERDLSGGENMAEIITGKLDYQTAKFYLVKILKLIDKYGYTTDKSSIHINISFEDKEIGNLNILKQILSTNEESIYKKFPSRRNNIYAKTIKKIIPFRDYDYSNISIGSVQNAIHVPDDKYYGINFMHLMSEQKRLEFRYIGGKDYHKQVGDIIEIMDEFIVNTYYNIEGGFTNKDVEDLSDFLDTKMNIFKNLSKYDNFLVEYPDIVIQVDGSDLYETVSAFYHKFYDKVYDILEACEDLGECIINYYIPTSKIEIINANIKSSDEISNVDLISCNIESGIFYDTYIYDCTIKNSDIYRARIDNTEVNDSRLINSNVSQSTLLDCFFQAGYLDAKMEGGIFRSGRIGENAFISDSTTIVGKEQESFFKTKDTETTDDKKK